MKSRFTLEFSPYCDEYADENVIDLLRGHNVTLYEADGCGTFGTLDGVVDHLDHDIGRVRPYIRLVNPLGEAQTVPLHKITKILYHRKAN